MVVALAEELLYAGRMSRSLPTGSDRIELVETFVRIVEAGSLSAAAARLGTSQPTVSRRLQVLEKWLRLRLLHRSTHAMSLTQDGERFFVRAQELLENWTALEEDLRGANTDPYGLLRVVVPQAFGQKQMVGPLLKFLKRYPRVSIEWLLHQRHPNFIADRVDCEIRLGAADDPTLVALHLAEVPRIVVAAPSLCGEDATQVSIDKLEAMPWISINTFYNDEVILTHTEVARTHRFSIKPRLSTDSVYAAHQATLAGFGVTLASAWIAAEDLDQGRLIHLVPDWQGISLPVYMVYPYARFYPAKLRRFLELMRKTMPALVGVRPPSKRGR